MRTVVILALALWVSPMALTAARAQSWGTIKGQIIWRGPLPKPEFAKIDKDQKHCPAQIPKGYVVDPKTRGLRWALVWLVPSAPGKPLPIHPALKAVNPREVVIDQPRCAFEPPLVGVRVGQKLVVKNSADISHNVKMEGGALGPELNKIIIPGSKVEVEELKARAMPFAITCSIHRWMAGYVGVFNHPYFTVTNDKGEFEIKNAPVGKYRMAIWVPTAWVVMEKGNFGKEGIPITIKPVTNLGKIEFTPPKEED
jgi:hypothetical protein